MRHLADTHALIWFISGSPRLSRNARFAFERSDAEIFVSAASAWEMTTKHRSGKLPDIDPRLASNVAGFIRTAGFQNLSISVAQAEMAGRFDDPHKDPFDRMIIAQALAEDLVLISNETIFDRFGVRRLW